MLCSYETEFVCCHKTYGFNYFNYSNFFNSYNKI